MAIESAIVQGEPYRGIATLWGLSDSAIARHTTNHLADALRLAREARALESGLTAGEPLDAAATKAADRLLTAAPGRDTDDAIATVCRVAEAHGRMKLHGDHRPPVEVNPETIETLLADPELAGRLSDYVLDEQLADAGQRELPERVP